MSATAGGGAEQREPRGGWLSVRVRPGVNRESVVAALFSVGAQSVQEDGEELVTLLADTTAADVVTCAVLAASPDAHVETAPAPPVDWTERWKESIHAQDLGAVVIAPPWLAEGVDPARAVIIEPGMAFGTGEHASTRGVARLLASIVRIGDRVADLGAGSAVLSIAAVKLGAAHAVAIEIDPDAIANAEQNVVLNGVGDRVTVLEGDAAQLLPLVAPARLVVANIISSVVVSLLATIADSLTEDGEAILGGILHDERSDMIGTLAAAGWTVTREDHEDVWWSAAIARR